MGNEAARYEYPDVLTSGGETYRPAALGRRRTDGEWEGRIEFGDAAGVKRVSTDVETTQPDAEAFRYWADGIGVAYLEGPGTRARARERIRDEAHGGASVPGGACPPRSVRGPCPG